MKIYNKVKLGKMLYYIELDVCYKYEDERTRLCLKNYKKDYYDGGDLGLLIKEVEKNYSREAVEKYNDGIWFLSDAVYIYDNIPFISSVGEYYVRESDNLVYSVSNITKEELDEYISKRNIKMKDNSKFDLANGFTWNVK